jgi:uncharacterized protein with PhoU and TrkA domain
MHYVSRIQELETLMAGDVLIVRGRTLSDKLRVCRLGPMFS